MKRYMFSNYRPKNNFDEYFKDNLNSAREILTPLLSSLDNMGLEELNRNHSAAKKLLLRHGATFRLNDTGLKGTERILSMHLTSLLPVAVLYRLLMLQIMKLNRYF